MKLREIFIIILSLVLITSCSSNDDTPNSGGNDGGTTPPNESVKITKMNSFTELPLKSIDFENETIGYVAASMLNNKSVASEIFKTIDGGNTWEKVFTDGSFYIEKIKVLKSNLIVAIAFTGEIIISKDSGKTWDINNVLTNKGIILKDITYDIHDEIYIVGYKEAIKKGVIFLSWNEGELWNEYVGNDEFQKMMENNMLSSVDYIKETGYMVIGGGLNDKGVLVGKYEGQYELIETQQAIRYNDIACKDGIVMAIGSNGIVNAENERGGIYGTYSSYDWQTFDYNNNNRLTAVALGTGRSKNIIVVGRNKSNNLADGEFMTFSKDNGDHWKRINHEFVTAAWNDVEALNENTFIAIGYKGLLVKIVIE
ncbi:WD40/YVTN/BNR-like repeat-containing protein [Tenacibaculum sp.]|uniref:WD40/YVTN/BNR-like repeat-containing protein n=1 Tax=Tenacibaculum sp. TaxID=1906242 RepID=UPI003D0B15A7